MIKLRLDPPGLQFYQEMCYRKHTREMCPNLHKLLQGFGMQVAESLMLKISKEKKAKRVILLYKRTTVYDYILILLILLRPGNQFNYRAYKSFHHIDACFI